MIKEIFGRNFEECPKKIFFARGFVRYLNHRPFRGESFNHFWKKFRERVSNARSQEVLKKKKFVRDEIHHSTHETTFLNPVNPSNKVNYHVCN